MGKATTKGDCLGYRPVVDGKTQEQYEWFSYEKVWEMAVDYSLALAKHDLLSTCSDEAEEVNGRKVRIKIRSA